jgi:hypothetical protein
MTLERILSEIDDAIRQGRVSRARVLVDQAMEAYPDSAYLQQVWRVIVPSTARRTTVGKSSREKGKRGERRAVKFYERTYPDAHRSTDQARDARHCDVEGTPFWVEAKEGKRPSIWAALRQAIEDRKTAGNHRPIHVFAHLTNGPTVIVMLADEYEEENLKR